ncbi:hypothetical protein ACOMHN_054942 [Nucella lapillus]
MVNGSPGDLGNISEYSKTLSGGTSVERKYRLNSLCSNRDVQMGTRKKQGRRRGRGGGGGGGGDGAGDGGANRGAGGGGGDQGKVKVRARKKTVNARGRRGSKYTVLIFKSQGQGVVQVYGEHSQMYLCFNRRGRLIIRHDVTDDGRCQFTEHLEDNYTMLQSRANKMWYVGFSKRGRRMKGYRSQDKRKRRCYQFNKEITEPTRKQRHRVGPFSRGNPSTNWLRRPTRKRRPAVMPDVDR